MDLGLLRPVESASKLESCGIRTARKLGLRPHLQLAVLGGPEGANGDSEPHHFIEPARRSIRQYACEAVSGRVASAPADGVC